MNENIKQHLPDVSTSDLEENGNIYYMNGQNGTEFDWYVNDKISDFMVFYNDETNLGAIKLTLYNDGQIQIYIYKDHGNTLIKEVKTTCHASKEEILNLAITLKREADDKKIFDASIDKITTDIQIDDATINDFKNNHQHYEILKKQKQLLNLKAYVSKKITSDGWKVGYMIKNKPLNALDSGWQFLAGNETDEYLRNPDNIEILSIASVSKLDNDILKYLDNPTTTEFIRISSSEFEPDNHNKEIYTEKR